MLLLFNKKGTVFEQVVCFISDMLAKESLYFRETLHNVSDTAILFMQLQL